MTDLRTDNPVQARQTGGSLRAWCGENKHFLVAATVLAVSTLGWYFAIDALGITLLKKPVPWPEGTEVDHKTFQNKSLPKTFGTDGRFARAEDGELFFTRDNKPILDGEPDGEITLKSVVLKQLKIGTALDRARLAERRSNWYVCRMYIDNKKRGKSFGVWRLNVYYYTGVRDQIPHVGEVCLAVGGATVIDSSEITFAAPACRRAPWNQPIEFRRTRWTAEDKRTGRWHEYVQYYVFSMNDGPFNSRNAVRCELMWPWVNHSYYAKIEFSPNNRITDIDEADAAAEEFVREFLPHVIDALPTRQTVKRLDESAD